MNKPVKGFLMSMSLLVCAAFVKPAIAATTYFGGSSFTPLFLDVGFMGREVNLDLPELDVKVNFSNTDIPHPGVLTVVTEQNKISTSSLSNTIIHDQITLNWQTNAPVSPESALLTIYTDKCADLKDRQCVLEQDIFGNIEIIKPAEINQEGFTARVALNAKLRLVHIPKEQTQEDPGYMTEGYASWYAYKNCNCAASPDFPKGSYVKVTRVSDPSKSVIVRINDYGPERDIFPDRVIDLDKVAFQQIAPLGAGVSYVIVEPVDSPPEPAPTPAIASQPTTPLWQY